MHAVIRQRNAALLAIQHGSDDMEVGDDMEARSTEDEEVDDDMGINPRTMIHRSSWTSSLMTRWRRWRRRGGGTMLSQQLSRNWVSAACELLSSVE